jgi:hypothetical protein
MCTVFPLKALCAPGSIIPDDITKCYQVIKKGKLYALKLHVKLSIGLEAYPDEIIYTNGNGVIVEDRGMQAFERVMSLEVDGRSLTSEELMNLVLPLFHYYTSDFYGTIIDGEYFKSLSNDGDKVKIILNRLKRVVTTPRTTCLANEWVLDYYVIKFLNGNNMIIHYIVRGEQKTFHIKEMNCVYLKEKFDIPPLPK